MRLIDVDALIGALHNHAFLEGDDRSICYNIIQKQPTIEPERKRGKWLDGSIPTYALCSVCSYQERFAYENNFCPNCGADMRGEESDCDYERAVEQLEHDMLHEPTFNPDDGSM